jgi:hypothetical protein
MPALSVATPSNDRKGEQGGVLQGKRDVVLLLPEHMWLRRVLLFRVELR